MVRLTKDTDLISSNSAQVHEATKARRNASTEQPRSYTPEQAIRIPLDYAPRLRATDNLRQARREKWCDRITFALLSLLMWTVFFGVMAGVYLTRTEGIAQGWLPLAMAFGSGSLLIGGYFASPRVRRVMSVAV